MGGPSWAEPTWWQMGQSVEELTSHGVSVHLEFSRMLITEVYQSQIIRKSTRSYLNFKNPKFKIWSTEDWHNRSPSSCLSHIKTRALWIKKRSGTIRESVMSLSDLYFLSGAQSDKWWPAALQQWATRDTEVEKFTVTGLEGPEWPNGEVKAECRERERWDLGHMPLLGSLREVVWCSLAQSTQPVRGGFW